MYPDAFAALHRRLILALGLVPLAACGELGEGTACIIVEPNTTQCPSKEEAEEILYSVTCGPRLGDVLGRGEYAYNQRDTGVSGPRCCYPVERAEHSVQTCVVGRPYREAGALVTAPRGRASGWSSGQRVRLRGLDHVARRVLGEAWAQEGLIEQASVAAFSRVSLELLATGAPADLVRDVHAAALDEVRHARLCMGLASSYLGEPVAPGHFPLGVGVPVATTLVDVAESTIREGCIAETLVALLDAEALARSTDPAVRRVLSVVTRDELRHSALAWRTLAWLLREGGAPVRERLAAALGELEDGAFLPPQSTVGAPAALLTGHGRLSQELTDRAWAKGITEVVAPALRAALERQPTANAPKRAGARAETPRYA